MTESLPARIHQLRLRDLMLLELVADHGSLTEAAQRLHVTQSAVTQALQGLEHAFGVSLVERGRRGQRGVRLTPAGQATLERLRVARHELLGALQAARAPEQSTLRIGTLPVASLSLLPLALARLRVALPSVHVVLAESNVPGLWQLLRQGEVDAIVSHLPVLNEQQPMPRDLVLETVGHETLVLVCAATHLLARRRVWPLAKLLQVDWVLPPMGSLTRAAFDQMFARAGLSAPDAVITSASFHANLRLAAHGAVFTLAPKSAVTGLAQGLGLATRAAPTAVAGTEIMLACRTSAAQRPELQALRASFRSD